MFKIKTEFSVGFYNEVHYGFSHKTISGESLYNVSASMQQGESTTILRDLTELQAKAAINFIFQMDLGSWINADTLKAHLIENVLSE